MIEEDDRMNDARHQEGDVVRGVPNPGTARAKRSLSSLRAGLPLLANPLAPSITSEAERSRYRASTQPYRAWYKTARWDRLRWHVLTRDCFTCAMCGRLEADTRNLVCDHKRPHRGDQVFFWDTNNLQTLCKPCHDKRKQQQEHHQTRGGTVNYLEVPPLADPACRHVEILSRR